MKQLIFKLFFTILGGVFMLYFIVPWTYFGLSVPFSGQPYKLGLDLQGGIELDYEVDLSQAEQEPDYDVARKKAIIEGLKSVIDKRVQALNINDSVITGASYGDSEHIIVQIPLKGNSSLENSANIEKAKEAIGKVVKIEFKESRGQALQEDIDQRKNLAEQILTEIQASTSLFDVTAQKYMDSYENISYGTSPDFTSVVVIPDTIDLEANTLDTGFSKEILEVQDSIGIVGYLAYQYIDGEYNYIFIQKEPSSWKPATDSQGRILNDAYFTKASVQYSEAFQPMVELTFNNEGAEIFGELTKRLIGQPIAIFVGGQLLTAPTVNDAILSGRAVITGNYTPEEANTLAQDINTGVVPAPIYLTSERTIDSRLGTNSLEKIIFAGAVGFFSILVFLVVIYRASGFISAIALFIYIVIILAILKYFGIVLTLASIAGLVLSIGIAIDANILIFERIKDELRSGKKLDTAVQSGFDGSFSAIWDSNITGLIVAVILFIFGINMIKGFGLILAIGILVSLFSVFFISRVFVKLLSKTDMNLSAFIGFKK